ncbi:ATP-binding cassette domain-containing protein [Streptomyces sp. NBC_01351]|uniref:ABC transporter permease subunit n=1 Tax=Streptomyces sp. NBC_01351 TaxID=2903833 RepID=UPI002E3817CA|nr:ATP-binding cassette domain-containing protein [Streptomyces sp. NBC_01351]
MASLTYELTLAGLAVGSAAALTGIGLIVTDRATGVLNLAHGAVAMVCAYVMRELVVRWSVPTGVAAALTVLLFAPAVGLLLNLLLSARDRPRDQVRDLTTTIGVFVLLIGVAVAVWGPGARADAPVLFGSEPWPQLATVLLTALLVAWTTRRTAFGRDLRAVVDNRALAELGGIDTARVAAAGWAFGAATAGLTGILLAPYVRLDPYGLPLLVLEVLAVAVAARLRSLPVAVGVALAIGVAQAQLTRFHPEGWPAPFLQALAANLFAVALLVAALLPASRSAAPTVAPAAGPARGGTLPPPVRTIAWLALAGLLLLPLRFGGAGLDTALRIPALAVILLSLVLVTGRGGQLSLGQAAYAGLGALLTAHLAAAGVPELVSLGLAALLVAPLGLLTGAPAIRRRGLAGAVPLSSGSVSWRTADVTRLPAHERARRGLCFVPDRQAVYPSLPVEENLRLFAPATPPHVPAPTPELALAAYPALAALLARTTGTLSGGEQRMLALSRALLSAPGTVLLLDEPTQGMSAAVAARTYELLAARAAEGAAVVLAEQRLPPALARPGVLVHELRRGTVVFSGEATE